MVRLSYLSLLAAGQHALGQSGSGAASGSQVSSVAAAIATSTSSNSNSNPLIPSDLSDSCQAYLESLNGNQQLSSCTSSLINAISAFTPASTSDAFTASSAQVSSALDSLCAQDGCDESLVRAQLGQFYGNCSAELNAGTEVVIGQYDVLYVLVPMTQAVCAKDSAGGWCVEDIATGTFPLASVSSPSALAQANATTSSAATDSASASAAVTDAASGVTSASDAAASSVAAGDSQAAVASSAVAATDSVAASAPVSAAAAAVATDAAASSAVASSAVVDSSAAVAAASSTAGDPTYVTPNVSSLVSAKQFSISSYVGAATSPQALFAYASSLSSHAARLARRAASAVLAARSASDATGVLPVASTWASSNLPFLFLSANMSSTLLCTACTSSVMAPYISWESRMPYPLGLSNSPMLGQQHVLWTGLGSTCGSGYLASITTKAGEQAVSSGAAGAWARPVAGAALAGVVAVVALFA